MMLPKLSRYALIILAIVVMSLYLPNLYNKIFDKKTGKTQLFFSPVIKKFMFREMVGEGHRFVTQDENGKTYDRQSFETLIPFVYYKNMELWGKLPLTIDGHVFDKQTIKKNRQVFEFKPRMIADRTPRIQVFPLFESKPGVTRLRFPKDAFRMTDRMEFINVDTNIVDEKMTGQFTQALKQAKFLFPAKLVAGKVSILKPFDEGFFIVDAGGDLFQIKRAKGQPVIVKITIPAGINIRSIKIPENKKKEIYGILLSQKGNLYLISYNKYRLIKMPLINYDPDTMDFKLLINPLYRTAVYSSNQTIYSVAMDNLYRPIAQYHRVMFTGKKTMADRVFEVIFPFYIKTMDKTSGYLQFNTVGSGRLFFIGNAFSLPFAVLIMRTRKFEFKKNWFDLTVVIFTGLYGLIATIIINPEP